MKSDIEIVKSVKPEDIFIIGRKVGIKEEEIIPWGGFKAKVSLEIFNRIKNNKDGKLILITTINPTPEGEGKTTLTIGLAQALVKLGKKTMLCIRQPSLGPTMGLKGEQLEVAIPRFFLWKILTYILLVICKLLLALIIF